LFVVPDEAEVAECHANPSFSLLFLPSCAFRWALPGEVRAAGKVTIIETTDDPEKVLQHDWSPSQAIERGIANSCVFRDSQVKGREHLCRVIDGHEETGDERNWLVDFPAEPDKGPLSIEGRNGGPKGIFIVLDGGTTFEGCDWISPSNDYHCDYRMRKPVVLKTKGNAREFVLRTFWDWSRYAASAYGCAEGIAGVLWKGDDIRKFFLSACFDGPLDPDR